MGRAGARGRGSRRRHRRRGGGPAGRLGAGALHAPSRARLRRAALLSAVAAGHPEGIDRLSDFEGDADPGVAAAARAAAERCVAIRRRWPSGSSARFNCAAGRGSVGDVDWKRRVAERLVRLLLCRGEEPVTEDELIEAFWPTNPPPRVAAASRSRCRRPGASSTWRTPSRAGSWPASARIVCRWARETPWTPTPSSVRPRRRWARRARDAGPPWSRPPAYGAGSPLPEERYADWAVPWRERLIDRHAEVLAALIEVLVGAGDLAAAADVARRLVDLDPVNEAAHRQLIVAYARAGQRGHALRQYLACRRALVAELGVEPGEETAALQRSVLAGEAV